ncbi:uncharacterized protein BJ212DRAFT_318565 [Suillus subaureus]|uniref:Uncharacterized protein n=1 Tax=Suillus subaureus TaxID=48587 RepID=A0A9P7EMI8_9AGAM|nr:uncharacterized protein BJ212DRAFT_318565 [Suillus subaureus]KAG1826007.1 hypothetical protein BJ212DRAFT_318565 [Suillus subaureus]
MPYRFGFIWLILLGHHLRHLYEDEAKLGDLQRSPRKLSDIVLLFLMEFPELKYRNVPWPHWPKANPANSKLLQSSFANEYYCCSVNLRALDLRQSLPPVLLFHAITKIILT